MRGRHLLFSVVVCEICDLCEVLCVALFAWAKADDVQNAVASSRPRQDGIAGRVVSCSALDSMDLNFSLSALETRIRWRIKVKKQGSFGELVREAVLLGSSWPLSRAEIQPGLRRAERMASALRSTMHLHFELHSCIEALVSLVHIGTVLGDILWTGSSDIGTTLFAICECSCEHECLERLFKAFWFGCDLHLLCKVWM